MIDFDLRNLRIEEKRFIVENNLYDSIGKPIEINSDVYYPILYKELYLRYYISYSGCIFDKINNKIKKFNIHDSVLLYSTDDDSKKLYEINEIIWRTFYRFPEGSYLPSNKSMKAESIFHNEKDSDGFYTINGVEFRKIKFPKDSVYYNNFVVKDKYRLIASEAGAIYDLNKKRFIMINIDENGIPYIYSKHQMRINLEKILIFSWHTNIPFNHKIHKIINLSPVKVFVDKYYVGIYNILDSSILNDLLVSQDISPFISKENLPDTVTNTNTVKLRWLYDDLGIKYQIPIAGLSEYTITKCGIIFTPQNRIKKPYKIIYSNDNRIVDILYKFQDNDMILSVSDILLWTFYRLTHEVVLKFTNDILIHANLYIPIIIQSYIITKPMHFGSSSLMIGDKLFTAVKGIPNLVISTDGAIFNTKHKYFIKLDNSTNVSIPNGNECKWINIPKIMYHSWYGRMPINGKISSKNGVCGDFRLINLKLNFGRKNIGGNKILESYRRTEEDVLNAIYGKYISANDSPIPEII